LELATPQRHPTPAPHRPVAKPAAKKAEPAFDPNRTSVDFMTLGEQVHQQNDAQDMFQASLAEGAQAEAAPPEPETAPAPEPAHHETPLPKYVRPPTAPIHIPKERSVPVWAIVAGGVALVAAVVVYFVMFD